MQVGIFFPPYFPSVYYSQFSWVICVFDSGLYFFYFNLYLLFWSTLMITKNHYYFLLSLNPWPLMVSLASFNLLFSLVIFFKFSFPQSLFMNLILVTTGRFAWWIYYRKEFTFEGKNSLRLENGVKFGIILFISSEIFFFFSFFWRYFHYLLSPTLEIGMSWPPICVMAFEVLNVPLINTLILLSSGVTVTLAHRLLIKSNYKIMIFFLGFTVILGFIFTFLQVLEYNSSFFSIRDGTFGTSFFVLTGFHGLHVIIGRIFLFVVFVGCTKILLSASRFLRFELASWYWHFVDVVDRKSVV